MLLAIAMAGLSACMQSPDCFRKDIFCAALVTNTLGINDHGLNQDAWAGLQQSKIDGLANQVAYIESVDTRDYEKNIAYFARLGYDMIITVGVGMGDVTLHAADLYPDTNFIGMDQPQAEIRPNLIPVIFPEDQMGFLAGALAAQLTHTRIVGAICETSALGSMWRYCEGFRAGTLSVDKDIKVLVQYRNSGSRDKLFIDEAWGASTAQGLIRRGADVLFAAGGATGQGALQVAAEAGIYAIGSERDQAMALGESNTKVVTSVYGRAGLEAETVVRMLQSGNITKPVSGQFGYVPLNEKFPENLTNMLNELLTGLLSGKVNTGVSPEKR